jgi:hypothetical protein
VRTTIIDVWTSPGQIGLAKSMRKYQLRRIVPYTAGFKAARSLPDG